MSAAGGFFWTGWATLAALGVYFWTLMNVGRGRGKFQVKAPSMDGPPAFLSMVRVQANTVEQLVLFLPALWLCALFRGDLIAAALGAVWVVGRIAYAIGYYRAPSKRGPGFAIAMVATACLVIATVLGLIGQLR
jgi:glutathione S-transferase